MAKLTRFIDDNDPGLRLCCPQYDSRLLALRKDCIAYSGMSTDPASALVWSLEYFLMSWSASFAWRRIAKSLTRILFGWLNWLDHLLAYRASALDGAGGFYFIGRRAEQVTLQARDMIGYYRGADDRK